MRRFSVGMFTLEQLVRSEGYAKQSMYGIIWGVVINSIFDVLLIAVLGWGIAGAGWAMLAANAASMMYYLQFLIRKSPNFSWKPSDFVIAGDIIKPRVRRGCRRTDSECKSDRFRAGAQQYCGRIR